MNRQWVRQLDPVRVLVDDVDPAMVEASPLQERVGLGVEQEQRRAAGCVRADHPQPRHPVEDLSGRAPPRMPPAGLADGAGVDEAGIVIRARRVSGSRLPADTALTKKPGRS
jgi:hypothetical protein